MSAGPRSDIYLKYRMKSCASCCKSGGKVRHILDFHKLDCGHIRTWACENCGRIQLPRSLVYFQPMDGASLWVAAPTVLPAVVRANGGAS